MTASGSMPGSGSARCSGGRTASEASSLPGVVSPSLDLRTPVIVGAAQVIQRPGSWTDPADARGPIELMAEAARTAAADAGVAALLARVGWVAVAGGWWRYADPARLVAGELGLAGVRTALSAISGSAPQELLGVAADRIARGELDAALVLGGEARWSHRRISRGGGEVAWITDDGGPPPDESFTSLPPQAMEEGRWFNGAPPAYALFEIARRAALGLDAAEHRDALGRLWAGYNAVAVDNPFAWGREPMDAAAIATPTPDNRLVAWPYTLAMVANNTVDMASALLVVSAEVAGAAGVAPDRWVFPHVIAKGHDSWLVAERDVLHRTPGAATVGRTALRYAGLRPDELGPIDLYACFPSSVEMTCDGLGISLERPLTVTGGLGFAGAPVGNAVGQSLAAMVARLRHTAGTPGLVQGNGGNATKHSFGVYSTAAPTRPFAFVDCTAELDLGERAAGPVDWAGPVAVEAYTVLHDRDGPTGALLAVRLPNAHGGGRVFATNDDPAVWAALVTDDHVGSTWTRDAQGAARPA